MAYGASGLHLLPVAPGFAQYIYVNSSDTMATVLGAGYFDNGPDAAPKLVVGDVIYARCSDGNMMLEVTAANATDGLCTVNRKGGDLPIRTFATGTSAALAKLSVGFYETGTAVDTASRNILPTPYVGAEVIVLRVGSGTATQSFDAGASASDVSLGASGGAAGGGTGVTYDAIGNRRINLRGEGEFFHVRASSTSRWRIVGVHFNNTVADEGASNFLLGT